jgi:tetratricopeptide (TPR) repeat protein
MLPLDSDTRLPPDAAVPSASGPSEALLGREISHYRIMGSLGVGGMGVVYRAVDLHLRRPVALKFLPPHLADSAEAKARFVREAQAASALDHPSIGTIYEIGEHEGQLFIAMALYEGETLAARIARGAMPSTEVEAILAALASALGAAHAAGVVHRDVKPGNVMLTHSGQVKLLDFGLAKLLDEAGAGDRSQTGEVIGTVAYMAPEQLRGDAVDHRADLWALGVVAYEMLAGETPYQGRSNVATLSRILADPPHDLGAERPDVPAHLAALVRSLLVKDPDERVQDAAQVMALLAPQSGALSAPNSRHPGLPPVRRRRHLLALSSMIALVLGATAGAWLLGREQPARSSGGAHLGRRAVAVLGFENLSGAEGLGWLSTAIAEMLRTELAAGEKLRVISGENVARMKAELSVRDTSGLPLDVLAKVGANLGTDLVVTGAYFAVGQAPRREIRVDVRLQEVATRASLGAATHTGSEALLFDLVSALGGQLRHALGGGELTAADAVRVRAAAPSQPEAVRCYAEGLERLRRFDALGARPLLEKAIAAEPGFPLAHAALAQALLDLGFEVKAREQAKRAFELAAQLRREERLLVEARYREATNDGRRAAEIYRALVEFFPDNLDYGLRLVAAHASAAQPEEARRALEALRRMPPPARDDPRLDLAEAVAASDAGDYRASLKAAVAAAAKGEARGARLLAAQARDREAWAAYSLGDTRRARAAGEQAMRLHAALGNQAGVALSLNALASTLGAQGDVSGALAGYTAALRVFREIGFRSEVCSMLCNLANILLPPGRLVEARRYVDEAIEVAREIQSAIHRGTAHLHRGRIATLQGRLDDAAVDLRMALRVLESSGERRMYTDAVMQLAFLLAQRGALGEARSRYEEAFRIRRALGYKMMIADTQVGLATLALEEGRPAEAEAQVRAAAAEFEAQKAIDREANARTVLVRALVAQGKLSQARAARDRAVAISGKSEDLRVRTMVAIADARVGATESGDVARRAALAAIAAEAAKAGVVYLALEARLALGEVESRGAHPRSGAARLSALAAEARRKGFLLLARKAARHSSERR